MFKPDPWIVPCVRQPTGETSMHPNILLPRPTHVPEGCRANLVAHHRGIDTANSALVNRHMWDRACTKTRTSEMESPPLMNKSGPFRSTRSVLHEKRAPHDGPILPDHHHKVGIRNKLVHIGGLRSMLLHHYAARCIHDAQVMRANIGNADRQQIGDRVREQRQQLLGCMFGDTDGWIGTDADAEGRILRRSRSVSYRPAQSRSGSAPDQQDRSRRHHCRSWPPTGDHHNCPTRARGRGRYWNPRH